MNGRVRRTAQTYKKRMQISLLPLRAHAQRSALYLLLITTTSRERSPLTAGHAHMPRQRRALMAPVDDEVVTLGLARNRLFDGGVQKLVAFGGTQRFAQIGGVFLAEAHIKR